MQSLSISKPKEELDAAIAEISALAPTLVVLFAAPALMRDASTVEKIKTAFNGTTCIGCSTSGEISANGLADDTLTFMAIRFDRTEIKPCVLPIPRVEDSYSTGAALAMQLKTPDLKAIFMLAPGTDINCDHLVHGMNDQLGPDVVISGGMAGDDDRFQQTYTLLNGDVFPNHVVAVGFYGDHVTVSTGSDSGWRPFGPARRVTRSDGHVLYEIDGKPALQLYKDYLGERARDLPASAMSYPFAVLHADRSTTGLIRTPMNVDHDKGVLLFGGDIPQDVWVCLTHADNESLTQGARASADHALQKNGGEKTGSCALLISCIGRRLILSIDTDEEIDAVREVMGDQIQIAGYYSYGEICPFAGTGRAELHNQTMTITYISERS